MVNCWTFQLSIASTVVENCTPMIDSWWLHISINGRPLMVIRHCTHTLASSMHTQTNYYWWSMVGHSNTRGVRIPMINILMVDGWTFHHSSMSSTPTINCHCACSSISSPWNVQSLTIDCPWNHRSASDLRATVKNTACVVTTFWIKVWYYNI